MSHIQTQTLPSGLTLLLEPNTSVSSVALTWLLPGGSSTDTEDGQGISAILSELAFRGAGGMDSRAHSDALDRAGVQRYSSVTTHHLKISATTIGTRFEEGMNLMAMLVLDPALPAGALDPVRQLSLQSLESLSDDPQHLVMLQLRAHHAPSPYNRHGYGERDVLERATHDQVREAWKRLIIPDGSILAIAGAIDGAQVIDQVSALTANWAGEENSTVAPAAPERGVHHDEQETAQVHIGLAYDAPAEPHRDSMLERLGIAVLSGGSSGRLFTEVRQKRSLCYSVGASYRAGRDHGQVALYAGTTPERAQETLDVSVQEMHRMREGVTSEEFERARIGLKSRLVMSGESTAARAGSLAHDFFRLGRTRTLEEIAGAIEAISLDELNAYLAGRTIGPFTVCSIGPRPLVAPSAIASAIA